MDTHAKGEEILAQYDNALASFNALSTSMSSLISTLLNDSSIHPHSISFRVKDRKSLSKKIEDKDKYQNLSQITDIVGIRIISKYSDQVDEIARIIEKEFALDIENSIDKRASHDPDRFGYLSLHYVVNINSDRERLSEYKRFKGMRFEVQIRSILQHTWAEIEHDMGYKTNIEVPKPIRRKFSRLAGLLELADDEFIKIRDELVLYRNTISETITSMPEAVTLDAISIYEFSNKSEIVNRLDKKIAEITGFKIKPMDTEVANRQIKYLKYFGIEFISQLQESLHQNQDIILKRAEDVASLKSENILTSRSISIFYLHQVLAATQLTTEKIVKFLTEMGLCRPDERQNFAEYLAELGIKHRKK